MNIEMNSNGDFVQLYTTPDELRSIASQLGSGPVEIAAHDVQIDEPITIYFNNGTGI